MKLGLPTALKRANTYHIWQLGTQLLMANQLLHTQGPKKPVPVLCRRGPSIVDKPLPYEWLFILSVQRQTLVRALFDLFSCMIPNPRGRSSLINTISTHWAVDQDLWLSQVSPSKYQDGWLWHCSRCTYPNNPFDTYKPHN